MIRSFAVALLATACLTSTAAAGRLAVAVAVEAWPDETVPLHGIALLAYDFDPWLGESQPSIVLNTDTLRLGLHEVQLGERWRLGAELAGEYAVAGLLTDYYVGGEARAELGFRASYVEAAARLKYLMGGGGWAELSATGRRWFFDRTDETDRSLILPAEAWVLMPRLHLGWWRLHDDAGWSERHRLFPRIRGFAVGIDAGLDLRSEAGPWGGRGAEGDGLSWDGRNDPEGLIVRVRQWARLGVPLGERVRVELDQKAGYGVDEDDLTRARIGGMNPYVVDVPGAPWAAWLSELFVGARLGLPISVAGDVQVAPTAAGVWLRDAGREGRDEMSLVWGAGAAVDARFGPWQVDLRGGVCPSLSDEGTAWSAYLGVGWGR